MDKLDYIRINFRSVFDGGPHMVYVVLITLLLAPYIYFIIRRIIERLGARRELLRELRATGLSADDCRLALKTAYRIDRERPARMLSSVALFNHYVDTLGSQNVDDALFSRLERVRKALYPNPHLVHAPQSTRDLPPGVTINLARQGVAGQVATCLMVHNDLSSMRLKPHSGSLSSIQAGDELSVYFPRPEAMYTAQCRVLSHGEQLVLAHAGGDRFHTRQLREYWRVDVDIDVHFMVVAESYAQSMPPLQRVPGKLINLSGSGAALVTRHLARRGQRIQFALPLQDLLLANMQAEVLHVVPLHNNLKRLHMVFRDLDPKDQDRIVRSLFQWYRAQAAQQRDGLPLE